MANRRGAGQSFSGAYCTLDDIFSRVDRMGEQPFIVALDCVEDPQNLGAIIRTAECAGVHGVVVPDRHTAPLGPGALKASAGAVRHMAVARASSIPNALVQLKRRGLWVVGADMDGRRRYWEERFDGPLVLVVGGEDHGLGRLTRELCDAVVRIPMSGKTHSLNASVSAALLMYEAVRQRSKR